ncbi:hypothetical protein ACSAZL_14020 [Methanosarcina sp. T3]|uniref:hypothetical protein n=1 Tax=Methanosarcina sp. T3 TaxID=3439062 RepID=UPI003F854FDE
MLRAHHPETVASVASILMSTIRSFRNLAAEAARYPVKQYFSHLGRLSQGSCGIKTLN